MFRDYPAANLDTHVDSGDSAMISSVAVIAPGAMGSAVAYRLTEHGIHVLTSLRGRGPQTLRRAAAAKMQDADDDAIARADVILSILPPAEALALAERFAVPLSLVQRKAMFVDCNAVNVETVRRISSIIEPTGASFVDGSIIGHPPDPQGGPTFYFSGSAAKELAAFEGLGLKVRIMEAPIGAASALKMAYAGINKGITLLVTAMVLGAARAGAADALHEELAEESTRPVGPYGAYYSGYVPESISMGSRDGRDRRIYRRRSDYQSHLWRTGNVVPAVRGGLLWRGS